MTFLDPGQFVWLLLVPVLTALWIRSPVALTPAGRRTLLALRLLAVTLLIAALARPVRLLPDRDARRAAVFAVDVSHSIPAAELGKARTHIEAAAARAARTGAKPRVLLFGRRAAALENLADWDRALAAPELAAARDGTDLEAALTEARALFEPGESGPVVLFTDGNATAGDLESGLARIRRAGVPVHPVALEPVTDPGIAVAALEVPERAFAGDTLDLVVKIRAAAAGTVRLVVRRDGAVLDAQRLAVPAGTTEVKVRSPEKRPGLARFQAQLEALSVPDPHPHDNEAHALCQVQPVPRVLIASRRTGTDDPLAAALRSQSIAHDVVPPAKLPRTPGELSAWSCVVLDDVPAADLPRGALDALERYNKDLGGGFVMVGGKSSFAAGGYVKTPLERMLPVDLPTKSYSVSSGVILLLDNSGSMTGKPLLVAKESAKALMRMLKGRLVGMWKFSSDTQEVFPPTLIGEDFAQIDERINRIVPEGGTQFVPPLRAAMASLESAAVENRYVILLSDGDPGDGADVRQLVDEMAAKKIKVSTVGIGMHVDPQLMHDIAMRSRGRYHQPTNLEDLEQAFRDEASHIVEGTPIIEEATTARLAKKHPVVRGFEAFPPLAGYVGTAIKPRAEAVLVSSMGDPLLAVWRYGLGVSIAYTPDSGGPWARAWTGWDGFARFWAQVVKATFRANESDYALRAQIRGARGEISVDAIDRTGAYLNFLPLFAQLHGPAGVARVELPQREPGRYQNTFPAAERGFYRVEIFRKDREAPLAVGGAVMTSSPEYLARPLNRDVLARIAQSTGGTVCAGDSLAILAGGAQGAPRERTQDAWTPLAVLALLVFFLEVALRRAGTFTRDPAEATGDAAALALGVAESFLRMARDLDAAGDATRAQEYYLKAHSHYLKARREEEAKRMWERYRLLEERRG